MKIILKYIVKDTFQNKWKSILLLMSLCISSMVIFLNFTLKDDLMKQYESVLRGSFKDFNYVIQKKKEYAYMDKFSSNEINLENLTVEKQFGLDRILGLFNWEQVQINSYIYGSDLDYLVKEGLIVINSKGDFNEMNYKLIISKNTSEKYHLSIADEIKINTEHGEIDLSIGAIAENKGIFLQENDRLMLFTSKETINNITNQKDNIRALYISVNDLSKESIDLFNNKNNEYVLIPLIDYKSIEYELENTNNFLLLIFIAVIILVFYLNLGVVRIIFANKMCDIGTLRSLGASKGLINTFLILENILYGLIGGLLGIIFSKWVHKFLLDMLGATVLQKSDLEMNYGTHTLYMLFSVGFVVFLQIVISIGEIYRINKKSIKDLLFEIISKKQEFSFKLTCFGGMCLLFSFCFFYWNNQYKLILSGLSFILAIGGTVCIIPLLLQLISKLFEYFLGVYNLASIKLSLKNTRNNKMIQSNVILITIMLAIMIIILLVSSSINKQFQKIIETFDGEIQLSGLSGSAEDYKKLEELNEVNTLNYIYYLFGDYEVNGAMYTIGIFGLNKDMIGIKDLSGKIKNLSKSEVLIDEVYAIKHQIQVGDKLTINIKNKLNIVLEVEGYIDSSTFTSSRNVFVISEENYKENISINPSCIGVKVNGDVKQAKASLANNLIGTGVVIETVEEFIGKNMSEVNSLLQLFQLILGAIYLFVIAGIVTNQVIGFFSRKKEYAVLYSVAMSKHQLGIMAFFEIFELAFLGCAFGTILGLYLSKVLEQILFGMGEYIKMQIDIEKMVGNIFGVFIFLVLINLFLLKNILNLNIVEEIKYE